MVKQDNLFTLGVVLVCSFYLLSAAKMPIGSLDNPGPGFLPIALGSVGLIISLFLLINGLRKKERSKQDLEKTEPKNLLRFLGYTIVIFSFIFSIKFIGTLLCVFILTLLLTKISGFKGWIFPFAISIGWALAVYILFSIWLKVPLPEGVFLINFNLF